MDDKYKDLDVELRSFTLDEDNALNYLDYVARTHVEQVLAGEEDCAGIEALIEDIIEMKNDIAIHDYEFVKFVRDDMSASHICILPMIEEQKLKEAIEDVARWVSGWCYIDDMPSIFKVKKDQVLFEKYVKEMKEK